MPLAAVPGSRLWDGWQEKEEGSVNDRDRLCPGPCRLCQQAARTWTQAIAIVEDLTPLNKKQLDRVSKHKAVKSTWTKDGRIFAVLADKRVVKIEKGDLSKLPRELSEPPPWDSQAGSNHSDQHRPAHDVQSVSSRLTPSTPTAYPTVSEGNETTPLW